MGERDGARQPAPELGGGPLPELSVLLAEQSLRSGPALRPAGRAWTVGLRHTLGGPHVRQRCRQGGIAPAWRRAGRTGRTFLTPVRDPQRARANLPIGEPRSTELDAPAAPGGRRSAHGLHRQGSAAGAAAGAVRGRRRRRRCRRPGGEPWRAGAARAWWCWASPRTAGPGWCAGPASGPQALRAALLRQRARLRTRWRGDAGVVDVGRRRRDSAPAARRHAERGPEAGLPAGAVSDLVARRWPPRCRSRRCRSPSGRWIASSTSTRASSCWSWAAITAWPGRWWRCWRAGGRPALGIVQPDAHTDLLPERLGVRICFATWAYHANDLHRPGRAPGPGRRAGLRPAPASTGSRTLGVRQFWAEEVAAAGRGGDAGRDRGAPARPRRRAGLLLQRHRRHRRRRLRRRPARPRRGGLQPDFVLRADRAGWAQSSTWWAPTWWRWRRRSDRPSRARRTVALGARYLLASPGRPAARGRAREDRDTPTGTTATATAAWDLLEAGEVDAGAERVADRAARAEEPERAGGPVPAGGLRRRRRRGRPGPGRCWTGPWSSTPAGPSPSCARPSCWPQRGDLERRPGARRPRA